MKFGFGAFLSILRGLYRARKAIFTLFCVTIMALDIHVLYYIRFNFKKGDGVYFTLFGDPQIEGFSKIERSPILGKYDLLFNDYYLNHVYQSTLKAVKPQLAVTMGDHFSSEWIDNEEFEWRSKRFGWITNSIYHSKRFNTRFYNMTGNHDIGYGSTTTKAHIDRWQNHFGELNHEFFLSDSGKIETSHSTESSHHVVFLNAVNIDESRHLESRNSVWEFINTKYLERKKLKAHDSVPLLLFIHIPLHKPNDLCFDDQLIVYDREGYVTRQNFLSPLSSIYLLHCLKPTFIFNGHDHFGCNVRYKVKNLTISPDEVHPDILKMLDATDSKNPTHFGALVTDLFCQSSISSLDQNRKIWVEIFENTIEYNTKKEGIIASQKQSSTDRISEESSISTQEITVRSTMGEYSGASGIFEFRKVLQNEAPVAKTVHTSIAKYYSKKLTSLVSFVLGNCGAKLDVGLKNEVYEYKYREIWFVHHIFARILVVLNICCAIIFLGLIRGVIARPFLFLSYKLGVVNYSKISTRERQPGKLA